VDGSADQDRQLREVAVLSALSVLSALVNPEDQLREVIL
jgi:hypothetical protein